MQAYYYQNYTPHDLEQTEAFVFIRFLETHLIMIYLFRNSSLLPLLRGFLNLTPKQSPPNQFNREASVFIN